MASEGVRLRIGSLAKAVLVTGQAYQEPKDALNEFVSFQELGALRFDPEARIVCSNEHHTDCLLVKDDEAALLDYLASLVAKEYMVYDNPRATPGFLAEEMIRMLVRVRRHIRRLR